MSAMPYQLLTKNSIPYQIENLKKNADNEFDVSSMLNKSQARGIFTAALHHLSFFLKSV